MTDSIKLRWTGGTTEINECIVDGCGEKPNVWLVVEIDVSSTLLMPKRMGLTYTNAALPTCDGHKLEVEKHLKEELLFSKVEIFNPQASNERKK